MMPSEPVLIHPDQALQMVLERSSLLSSEEVSLDDSLGRVCAIEIKSEQPVPGFDSSAMDGYAVIAADTTGATEQLPAALKLVGESRAGHPASEVLAAGQAIGISTGAVVPQGADAVVRVEDTLEHADGIAIAVAVDPGKDIRRAGEDIAVGETVFAGGTVIGPAELGVIVAVGHSVARCTRRPRVAVLATGDELRRPGEPLGPGLIHNTNTYSLAAQARVAGAEIVLSQVVPDDRDATVNALRTALASADVLVLSGGVSVGEHDHVKPALAELGVEEVFWRVAQKPGKPLWFGAATSADRETPTLVFGLPGNPVSAMVCFHLYVRPALHAMTGRDTVTRTVEATFDQRHKRSPGRMDFLRCRVELRSDGWHASPTKDQRSHILTSMVGAEGLARIEQERGDVEPGELVKVELLAERSL